MDGLGDAYRNVFKMVCILALVAVVTATIAAFGLGWWLGSRG